MAAYELRRSGYPVTLFEAEALGGALRLSIPAYRLPREVLEREVGLVARLGATVRLRTRLGRDVHLEDLRRDFAAVFLAVGCRRGLLLETGGEQPGRGVSTASIFCGPPTPPLPRQWVAGWSSSAGATPRWMPPAPPGGLGPGKSISSSRRAEALMPALASEVEAAAPGWGPIPFPHPAGASSR